MQRKGEFVKEEEESMKIQLLNVLAKDSQSFWQSKHALIIQQEQRESEREEAAERHAETADKTDKNSGK